MCLWVSGIQCPSNYSSYTIDDAMTRLGKYYTFEFLRWRADPLMFHQANLVCDGSLDHEESVYMRENGMPCLFYMYNGCAMLFF